MNRSELGFDKKVRKYFNYLINEYGFTIIREETTLVVLKRDNMTINIFHGRQSYEIGVEIKFPEGNVATLYEILEVISPEDSRKVIKQASDENSVEISLIEISQVFKTKCREILGNEANETELFKKISQKRKNYTDKYQYGALKDKAEVAWQNKNYSVAKEIYINISEHLNEKEKRRLNYLKQKLT